MVKSLNVIQKVWRQRMVVAEECLLSTRRCLLSEGCDATWIKANLQMRIYVIGDSCHSKFSPSSSQGFQHVQYRFWIRITLTQLLLCVEDDKSWTSKPGLHFLELQWRWKTSDDELTMIRWLVLSIITYQRIFCEFFQQPSVPLLCNPTSLFSPSLVIDWILCQWPSQWKL